MGWNMEPYSRSRSLSARILACSFIVTTLACTVEDEPATDADDVDPEELASFDPELEFRGGSGTGPTGTGPLPPSTTPEGYDEVVCAKFVSIARATVQNMMNSCAECGGDGAIPAGVCCEMSSEAMDMLLYLLDTPCARHPNIIEQIEEVVALLTQCHALCDGCGTWAMGATCNSCWHDGYTACQEHTGFVCCGVI